VEYFGPTRLSYGDIRKDQLVFSDAFKYGNKAADGSAWTVEIDPSPGREKHYDAYDPTRVCASFKVQSIEPDGFFTQKQDGQERNYFSKTNVIAVRLDAEGNETDECIKFQLAYYSTTGLDHVYLGQPCGAYVSEHGGLCLRGDVAFQNEEERYRRESYQNDDRVNDREIIDDARVLTRLQEIAAEVQRRIKSKTHSYDYLQSNPLRMSAKIAGKSAHCGRKIPRLICRESATGPVEQFVNIVPIEVAQVGDAWRIKCFSGTCSSFWTEDNLSEIWWSNTLYQGVPPGSTSIVFIAV